MPHPHYPNVLVTCQEAEALLKQNVRVIQVDQAEMVYQHGHIEGALFWPWLSLRDQENSDILTEEQFLDMMASSGISNTTPVLLYGDDNNWFAFWAYWILKLYGHPSVKVIDGGLNQWLAEGRSLTKLTASYPRDDYRTNGTAEKIRASVEDVFVAMFDAEDNVVIDVRSPMEYAGQLTGPGMGAVSTCQRGGHIPGALNIPWERCCHEDGTLRPPPELKSLFAEFDIHPDQVIITYCAIGERSSVAWFVLHELLGYKKVLNFDRSMSVYSQLQNAPLETGAGQARSIA